MRFLEPLFEKNRQWAARMQARDPKFFERLIGQQNPQYLWIGCSDSRVPANEIIDLLPGEVFVHRNVANVVHAGDMNCLSVLQFAVEVLGVRHVMVVGHYGCGGVKQALEEGGMGMIDHWLAPVRRVRRRNQDALERLPTAKARWDRLCELNVIEQGDCGVANKHHSRVMGGRTRNRSARLDLRSCRWPKLRWISERHGNIGPGSRRVARSFCNGRVQTRRARSALVAIQIEFRARANPFREPSRFSLWRAERNAAVARRL